MLISTFHKEHLDKLIASLTPIDTVFSMAKPILRLKALAIKQKQGRPAKANGVYKYTKKSGVFDF